MIFTTIHIMFYSQINYKIYLDNAYGKIKCRKPINLNVSFPTFFNDTINIKVILKWMKKIMKKMIRLKIKPNFAVLSREYGCNYRTAKIKYLEELSKEKGTESTIKIRKHFYEDKFDK